MNGQFLTTDEVLTVLKAARNESSRDWAMILLAYRHGMRASEVCGLTMADLDMKGEAVVVRRLKGSMTTSQPLYRHRGQPLLDEVKALGAYLKERKADGSEYLFLSQKGGCLSRVQFFRIFQHIAEAAGLPEGKRNPHILKHSLISNLVGENVNPYLIKTAVGHRALSRSEERRV